MLIYTFSPFKEAETEGDDDCSISRFPQKKKFFSRILILSVFGNTKIASSTVSENFNAAKLTHFFFGGGGKCFKLPDSGPVWPD